VLGSSPKQGAALGSEGLRTDVLLMLVMQLFRDASAVVNKLCNTFLRK
jgi:hypothetical protein